ncbi:MAG: imidazolonepropionase [Polyangiaceae bacterium]
MSKGLLILNAAEVVTVSGFSEAPARGKRQSELGVLRDAGVFAKDGRIVAVGASERLRRDHRDDADEIVDACGGVVVPGFVDSHTHLVFAGDRADEWEQRMQGADYLDILRRGGGILSTVKRTRAASAEALLAGARRWARTALEFGTTTLEVKSGYCLDREGELKLLGVARQLAAELPAEVVSTFLGAHVVPPEYKQRREAYVELVIATAREAKERGLAEFFDVFCEREAFDLDETARLCREAKALGYALKLHAEQFTDLGATRLAIELGATSVDHLENVGDDTLTALASAQSPPIAVLLPAVAFHLAQHEHAPGRRLVDSGVPVALATDMNPGSSFTPCMPMAIAIACRTQGLSVAEAVVASTINAAHALGRQRSVGSLEPGKRANLLVCDVPEYRFLGYAFGINPVRTVVVDGKVAASRAH